MKKRPVLFKADMVRAILKCHKTQTRRIVKKQEGLTFWRRFNRELGARFAFRSDVSCFEKKSPYGQEGDRLWVKETSIIAPKRFAPPDDSCIPDSDGDLRYIQYLATHSCTEAADDYKLKKTPSIFMPCWASRITLEITGVRVERLNDIIEQDAEAEGIQFIRDYPDADETLTAKQLYSFLWDSINGEGSWDLNPWVWVIEFRRVEK